MTNSRFQNKFLKMGQKKTKCFIDNSLIDVLTLSSKKMLKNLVSILPIISKIFERLLFSQLPSFSIKSFAFISTDLEKGLVQTLLSCHVRKMKILWWYGSLSLTLHLECYLLNCQRHLIFSWTFINSKDTRVQFQLHVSKAHIQRTKWKKLKN